MQIQYILVRKITNDARLAYLVCFALLFYIMGVRLIILGSSRAVSCPVSMPQAALIRYGISIHAMQFDVQKPEILAYKSMPVIRSSRLYFERKECNSAHADS